MHLGYDNPCYQYKLGDVRTGHSLAEEDLGRLVDGKPDMSQKCDLIALNVNSILGCIKRKVTSRARYVIVSLCLALVRPHLE